MRHRLVDRLAVASLELLGIEDQLGAFGQGLFDLGLAGIIDHAERFGKHCGADAVLVHLGVAVIAGQQTVILLLGEDEVDGLVEGVAIRPLSGHDAREPGKP